MGRSRAPEWSTQTSVLIGTIQTHHGLCAFRDLWPSDFPMHPLNTTPVQVMADVRAEANRMTALREAAINATLNHPYIVTTYTYDMQPLGDTQTSGRGFLDWQMYIIQVGLP